jgi:hypothetical protein
MTVNNELGHRDRQAKPAWSGAAWIDIENTIPPLHGGLVGVPGHDDVHARSAGIKIHLSDVVQRVEKKFTQLHKLGIGQQLGPGTFVVVPANGRDGRQSRQLGKDSGVPDVAAVDDVITTAKKGDRLRPEQPMCVGDEADACHAFGRSAYCATAVAREGRWLRRVAGKEWSALAVIGLLAPTDS